VNREGGLMQLIAYAISGISLAAVAFAVIRGRRKVPSLEGTQKEEESQTELR
jgi:hypothetical protein